MMGDGTQILDDGSGANADPNLVLQQQRQLVTPTTPTPPATMPSPTASIPAPPPLPALPGGDASTGLVNTAPATAPSSTPAASPPIAAAPNTPTTSLPTGDAGKLTTGTGQVAATPAIPAPPPLPLTEATQTPPTVLPANGPATISPTATGTAAPLNPGDKGAGWFTSGGAALYDSSSTVAGTPGMYASVYSSSNPYPPGSDAYNYYNNNPYAPGGSASAWYINNQGTKDQLAHLSALVPNGKGQLSDPSNPSGPGWDPSLAGALKEIDQLKTQATADSPELESQIDAIWKKYGYSQGDPSAVAMANVNALANKATAAGNPNLIYDPAFTGGLIIGNGSDPNNDPAVAAFREQNEKTANSNYLINGLNVDANGNAVAGGYNALTDLYRQLGTTPGTVNQSVIDLVKQNPALVDTLPADQAATLRASLSSAGVTVPSASTPLVAPGAPNDTNPGTATTPGGATLGSAVPIAGSGTGGTTGTSGGAAGGNGQPYTDANVAIGSTVLPNTDPRLASLQALVDSSASNLAGVDRTKLAQDEFNTFASSTAPAYAAALRSATQAGAGAGRVGSGMLRTSYGDLANQRDLQLQNEQDTLMQNAENGSIQDQFDKTSALAGLESELYGEGADTNNQLRTERGYQGSLEDQAFQRALEEYELDQQSKQQQFTNGLSLTQVGNSTNPDAYYAQLAAQLGVDPSVITNLAKTLGQKAA